MGGVWDTGGGGMIPLCAGSAIVFDVYMFASTALLRIHLRVKS
jgi:hypothetical protein